MNMTTKILTIVGFMATFQSMNAFAEDQHVSGYERKDGTWVQPYERTKANDTRNDNYSTKGNVNPYTGESGTKPNDFSYGHSK